ncbi:MAG TPA: hypothetical protein VFK56_03820 [Mycobacterium sp.]|nr:hypothetical protein [Mycobacterium sp.]
MGTRRWATEETTADWTERIQAEMRKMVWSQPSIKHWFYKNNFGEIYGLSPWRLVDYRTWTREPDPDDFVLRSSELPSPAYSSTVITAARERCRRRDPSSCRCS